MRSPRLVAILLLAAAGGLLPALPAAAAPPCTSVPSQTQPGLSVADPRCEFDGAGYTGTRFEPLTDAGRPLSRVYTGVRAGAAFRLEVPLRWNGDLMLYARGYQGEGGTVWVNDPPLRDYAVRHGFAWAASSYQRNGYDIGHGVTDTHALISVFAGLVRAPRLVYLTGASMGGQVVAVSVEKYRDYAGALPLCGVLADKELFDFYLDETATAAALTGTPLRFPAAGGGAAYAPGYVTGMRAALPRLGSGFATGDPAAVTLTATGRQWASVVAERSGGARPGFPAAVQFWTSATFAPLTTLPLPLGLYPGVTGGDRFVLGGAPFATGNVTGNARTVYRFAGARGPLSPAERALNAAVLRVSPTARPSRDLSGLPAVAGDPRIPVLTLHDVGDLLVPISMEQYYARRVAAHHQSALLVSRAIRGMGHCEFTPTELGTAFADLVSWVRHGNRPA
ncbi:MAG: hypothetical protein V7637_690, partial [Mycobacteriales bacterium]